MAIPLYGVFNQYSDDEEKKKTPSQRAAEQVKQGQSKYYGVFAKVGEEVTKQKASFPKEPEEQPTPPEPTKPNFFQRAVEAVSGVFRKITSKPVISPIPEEKPQPSLFDQAYQAVQKPLTKVDSIFESLPSFVKKSPAEVAVESAQNWLAKPENEKVAFALSKVQELAEADFKRRPESLGFVKGAAGTYMAHMKSFEDYFNTDVNVPKDTFGKARYKVGELVGEVVGLMGGGVATKALGLGRAALPVLFAVTGQTSAPSSLTVTQRIAKAPVDLLTGYLFGKVPLSEKIISKETVKGALGVAAVTYPTSFISYLIQGLPKEEAAKVAAQAAFVQALFHVGMTGVNQLTRTPTLQNEVIMTPEQIRTQVEGTRIGDTPQGKQLLEVAQKAETMGKSAKIKVAAVKESPLAKAIGKEATEAVTGKPQEIKFTDGTGAQAVMQVEFVDKPEIKLLKEEGTPSAPQQPVKLVVAPVKPTKIEGRWIVTEDKGGIPGESPLQKFIDKNGKSIAALFDSEKGGYYIERSDGTKLYNPKTESAIFDTIEKAEKEFIGKELSQKAVSKKELEPLAEEARKYKSAEEFLKNQKIVYRGGEKLDLSKISRQGISISTSKDVAREFGKGATIEEFFIAPNAKIATIQDAPQIAKEAFPQASPEMALESLKLHLGVEMSPRILDIFRKHGFDAIDYKDISPVFAENEVRILNPDVLKTKSQLTDFYTQAIKGIPIKTISEPSLREKAKELGVNMPDEFRSVRERQSFEQLVDSSKDMIQRYIGKFGSHVNPDKAKELFEGYNQINSMEYDKASGNLARLVYSKLLEEHKDAENKKVMLVGGGTGSGKTTTAIAAGEDYTIRFDSTLSNVERARRYIDSALEKNYTVRVKYIYRPPEKAFKEGVLQRYEKGETRTVPIDKHIETHINARDTALQLYEAYKDDPNVTVSFFYNPGDVDDIKEVSFDSIKSIQYNEDVLRRSLYEYSTKLYQDGKITKEQYDAITAGGEQAAHRGAEAGGTNEPRRTQEDQGAKKPPSGVTAPPAKSRKPVTADPAKVYTVLNKGRKSLPILETLLIKDGRVFSTDLTVGVTFKSDLEDGLYKLIGKEMVKVAGDMNDYPQQYETPTEMAGEVSGELLAAEIKKARLFINDDSIRPLLEGINFEFKNGKLTIAATDGFRLYRQELPANVSKDATFIIIGAKQIARLADVLRVGDVSIKFDMKIQTASLTAAEVTITTRLIDEAFPAYQKIYPSFEKQIVISKTALQNAIRTIEPYAKDANYVSRYAVKDNELIAEAKNREDLEKKVSVPIEVKEISIPEKSIMNGALLMPLRVQEVSEETLSFNAQYLSDILKAFDGDEIRLNLHTKEGKIESLSPIHISDKVEEITQYEEPKPVENEEKRRMPSGEASTRAQAVGTFENVEPKHSEAKNVKLFKKVQELIDKYAKTIGEGYAPRGALGVHYTDTGNIRVNGMNNLSVAAHEITHFLDHAFNISERVRGIVGYTVDGKPKYDSATLSYRKEITDLYTTYYLGGKKEHPLKKRMIEGFATLLQKYVEMPKAIGGQYLTLVRDFLTEGGKFYEPVIGDIIKDLREIVAEYQSLSSLDKIGTQVTMENADVGKKSFLSFFDKVRTEVADNVYPLEVLAKKAGLSFTQKDPSLWVRLYNNINQVIFTNMNGKRGYYAFRGGEFVKLHDFNWKTLIDGLGKEKTVDSFGYYLVARRSYFTYLEFDKAKEAYEQVKKQVEAIEVNEAKNTVNSDGKRLLDEYREAKSAYLTLKAILANDGITREEVTNAYLENKDRFAQEEKMFDALVSEDLKLLNDPDVQLLKNEDYERLASKQGYASFKRQFYDEITGEETFTGVAKVGKTRVSSLLQRKGSVRAILHPVYSGITNHAEIVKKALKQIVYNRLGEIAQSAMFPDLFQKIKLESAVQSDGRITYPQEKDPKIIMARIDYKRAPILVDNVVKRTIDEVLTFQNIGVFEQLLLASNRFFTKGTTGLFPGFAITNYAVDQVTAVAQTRNNYVPIYIALKELSKVILDSKGYQATYYAEYLALGGEKQTFVGWQNLSPNELFKRVYGEQNGLVKIADLINNGMDIFAVPSKYSEVATRATEYIRARMAGKPQVVALEEAGRVTAPFHHIGRLGGGRFGQTFVKSIPFFNPAIQVLDQALRSGINKLSRRRFWIVALAVTAALISSFALLMKKGTKEQKQLYKDLQPGELTKYLWLPHPDGKRLVKLRMPDQLTFIGTIINMTLADMLINAKYTMGDYVTAGTAFLPQQFDIMDPARAFLAWIPQLLKPMTLAIANVKDFPKVMPLENQHLQSLPPRFRSIEITSELAKLLGDKLNLSPVKIDYLLTGYFGRVVGFITVKPNAYNPFNAVVRENYFTSGRVVQRYYDLKQKNDQEYAVLDRGKPGQRVENYSLAEKMRIRRMRQKINVIEDLLKEYRKLDIDKTPDKAQRLRDAILEKIEKF